jgi:hypothetical protein
MMRTARKLRPWSLDALLERERTFDGLISKAVKMALRPLAMNVGGLLTAAVEAELSLSDLPSSMLGPTVSMDSAGALSVSWDKFVDGELLPFLADTFMDGAAKAHAALPADTPVVVDFIAQDYLATAANNLRNIGDLVWMSIRSELQDGVDAGEDMRQLATRVRAASQVTAGRAMTIARTEVHRAAEAGSLAQMRLSGFTNFECRKRWLATEDERTRLAHIQADGQTVGLNEVFEVGGEGLQFPGDPMGRADNTINCRCTMEYLFDDDEDDALTSSGVPSQVTYALWTEEDERVHPRDNTGRFRRKDEHVGKVLKDVSEKVSVAAEPEISLRDILPLVNENTVTPPKIPKDVIKKLKDTFTGNFGEFNTKVTSIEWAFGNARLRVGGEIHDSKGREVGEFKRIFKVTKDGTYMVEHEYLLMDSDVQGQGFAKEFNAHAFANYKNMGVERVQLQANIDVGGYAWAREGYDRAPDDVPALAEMSDRIKSTRAPQTTAPPPRTEQQIDGNFFPTSHQLYKIPEERREEQAALAQKLWLDIGETVDMDTEIDELRDVIEMWPTPFELSQLGRWPGAGKDDWWVGKAIMYGSTWIGVKYLDDLVDA